jgi:hypothetical protein
MDSALQQAARVAIARAAPAAIAENTAKSVHEDECHLNARCYIFVCA